jgi:hypothetical protein
MIRLYLLIKSQPDIVNQKYLMFNGTERSFADLMSDDGQNALFSTAAPMSFMLFSNIDKAFFGGMDDVSLMTELYHKIRINSHAIMSEDYSEGPVGHGLSIQISALNHSCRPNTCPVFKGNVAEVRAMRDIAAGEEVTMNYILPYKPKAVRHQELAESREFICRCEWCEAGDTPEELEALEKMAEVNRFRFMCPDAPKSPAMLQMMRDELVIREKIQGPFHPLLTNDMMGAIMAKINSKTSFTAKDKENMQILIEKVNKSFPITHGPDHSLFEFVSMLPEFLKRV